MRLRKCVGSILLLALVFCWQASEARAQKTLITLKDGTRIGPGILEQHSTISRNSMQRGQSETAALSIKSIDDDLRLTYFHQARVASAVPSTSVPEEIVLPLASEAQAGPGSFAIRSVLSVTKFNRDGRRFYCILGNHGREDILQGITHITPLYARVQTLKDPAAKPRTWDQRIATSTIPAEDLKMILHHQLNMDSPTERMRIVRFYLQAERYIEARAELIDALAKFPDQLAEQQGLLVTLEQALADQMFREIEVLRRSGQHQYVAALLQGFAQEVASQAVNETQLKVQDQLDLLKSTVAQLAGLVQSMKGHLAELPNGDAELARPVVDQIEKELSIESQGRLSDYARFATQDNLKADQKLAFAIGGWLMGAGAGVNNFEVAKSAIKVQALVREYLTTASPARREEILESLEREEAGRPELVGRIIGAMKPVLDLPAHVASDPPGLYRIELPAHETSGAVEYSVQLPPEYNPYRRYPCIVALHGLGGPRDMPIDWWCGAVHPQRQARMGIAARYGYIVIAPKWAEDGQLQYNYTGVEHNRVLRSLRDAYRRLSIDTNRVFVSGHFDGGAVAWDVALSHPDLWAGAVMLSPSSEKYILMYGSNAGHVPTYTVWGEFDNTSFATNIGRTVDTYLKRPAFDAIGVEYKGRPRDHFLEETPRIMDWMEMTNHRRDPNPREINVEAVRPGDRFFYWFEMPEIDADKIVSPFQFDMKRENKIEAKLQPAGTAIQLVKYPAKSAWVWLRPGLIPFGQAVSVQAKGSRKVNHTFRGDNRILLEDVRTRADRVAPFYDKIEL